MLIDNKSKALAFALFAGSAEAFLPSSGRGQHGLSPLSTSSPTVSRAFVSGNDKRSFVSSQPLHATTLQTDEEVEKLQSMAAKLRAEAELLETEQQMAAREATAREFQRFDTNMDGEITLDELKAGLEKVFKMEVSEGRINQLMQDLDASGDGVLQLEEFIGVDRIRNRYDAKVREEKALAREAQKAARAEQEAAELAESQMAILNDNPPSATDKALSVIPYLFPLVDGLQYARFLVLAHPNNPLSIAAGALFGAYQAVPLGGLLAFFSLIILSGNPQINKLVRFNMVQAAYMDTALFVPGALVSLVATVAQATGHPLPPVVGEIATDATFFALLAAVAYSSVSSVLGETPNKLPFLSNVVQNRQLTASEFDESGRCIGPPDARDDDSKNDET